MLAAAVVAATGVALGILVRKLRTLGGKNRGACVVLGGNKFNVIFLPRVFGRNGLGDFRIGLNKGLAAVKHAEGPWFLSF